MPQTPPMQRLQVPQSVFRSDNNASSPSESSLGYSSNSGGGTPPLNPNQEKFLGSSKYHELFSDEDGLTEKRWMAEDRIKKSSQYILRSQDAVKDTLEQSYLFEDGLQCKDEHYSEIFLDYFTEMHGGKKLVAGCSSRLAYDCASYKDVSRVEVRTIDGGDYDDIVTTSYYPTSQLVAELNAVLANKYGLQNELLITLKKHNKRFASAGGGEGIELKARDHWLSREPKDSPYKQNVLLHMPIAAIARLFPKCLEALNSIYQELLIAEWLKEDIAGIKQYLQETKGPEKPLKGLTQEELTKAIALWVAAKYHGEQKQKHDEAISKRNWNAFKDDFCGVAVSAGLSYATANPSYVIGQASRFAINQAAASVDPEGQDTVVQVLKLFGGASLGGALGAGKWDLAKALGVDLLALAAKDSITRNLGSSILKGVLTQDKRKMLCEILGGIVAETVAAHAPDTDENTKLEDRIFRALITNSDMQSYYVQKYVDQRFNTTKPAVADTDDAANSEAQTQKPKTKQTTDAVDKDQDAAIAIAKTQTQETVDTVVKQLEELDRAIAVGQEHVANLQRQALDTHEASIALKAVTEQRSALIAQHPAVSPTKLTEDIFQERSVIDEMRYLELAAIEQRTQQLGLELDQAKSALAGHTQAVQDAAKKEQRLHEENKKTRLIPKPKLHEKWQKVQRKLAEKQQSLSAATQHVSALEEQLHAQAKAQLAASNPPLEVQQALSELNQKDSKVTSSSHGVGDALERYQEHGKKDKYHDKLKRKVKAHNANLQDRDAAYNNLQGLLSNGEPTQQVATPQLKAPEKASRMEKALLWANKNVVVSSYEAQQPPIGYGYGLEKPVAPPTEKCSIYQEGRHQVALESSSLPMQQTQVTSVSSGGNGANGGSSYGYGSWAAVQQYEQEKILATNIAYRSRKTKQQPAPPQPHSILAVPSIAKGTGMAHSTQGKQRQRSMQLAGFSGLSGMQRPVGPKGLLEFAMADTEMQAKYQRNPLDNDFVKSIPKGVIKTVQAGLCLMMPDMSSRPQAECPKKHLKRVSKNILKKYDQVMQIKDPASFPAKAGECTGELLTLGSIGKVISFVNGGTGTSLFMLANEGGLYGLVQAEAHDTNKVAGVAFGYAAGSIPIAFKALRYTKPMQDRSLVLGATRDARFMAALEQQRMRMLQNMHTPVYHSGLGAPWSEMLPMRFNTLAKRSIEKIEHKALQATRGVNRSNNHQFVTWVEKGQERVVSIGEMSHAGTFHDRGGLSQAGRALEKKGGRAGSVFTKPKGSIHQKNMEGQRILDEILNHPGKKILKEPHLNFGEVIDIWHPDGHGARFTRDGKKMIGFLEPKK